MHAEPVTLEIKISTLNLYFCIMQHIPKKGKNFK